MEALGKLSECGLPADSCTAVGTKGQLICKPTLVPQNCMLGRNRYCLPFFKSRLPNWKLLSSVCPVLLVCHWHSCACSPHFLTLKCVSYPMYCHLVDLVKPEQLGGVSIASCFWMAGQHFFFILGAFILLVREGWERKLSYAYSYL